MQSSKDENQVEDANSSGNEIVNNQKNKSDSDDKNITTLSVGYVSIFVLLVFVVIILLLLYFFYNVMSKKPSFLSLYLLQFIPSNLNFIRISLFCLCDILFGCICSYIQNWHFGHRENQLFSLQVSCLFLNCLLQYAEMKLIFY
jgi:hypothetical protein